MPHARINGISLHYRFDGPADAPVLLMSNSLASTLEMWDPQLSALTDDWRVLRYDSRGHGRSDAPPGPYSIDMLAEDAVALLDHHGIEKAHFCGLSKGGMVGQVLGASHGDRMSSLTLCDTAPYMGGSAATWDERIAGARASGMAALAQGTLDRWLTAGFQQRDPAATDKVRTMISNTPVEGYVGCCEAIKAMDLRERIRSIATPTMVIVGELDPSTTAAIAREIQASIAGAELTIIPGCLHLPNIEETDSFNAALTGFLNRHR